MRHAYVVTIDTDTGEACAAQITRAQVNRLTIAAGAPRAVECGHDYADSARAALASIMPEPDQDGYDLQDQREREDYHTYHDDTRARG